MTTVAQPLRNPGRHPVPSHGGQGLLNRVPKLVGTLFVALATAMSMSSVAAQADDGDLVPGPSVIKDSNSPTGYTVQFVFHDPDASNVTFVADIMLRDWEDPSNTTVYAPDQYRPGLMRGGGASEMEMTDAGDGYWVTEVPLAAGANQYWFYVDGDTNLWVTDPANPPLYAPDGLTGTARRAFNKVNVPYDAEKQNYAPMAAREIEIPRAGSPDANWSYVPLEIGPATRTLGVYLPPGYDADRSEPYKTIYMQHGGGQDQSDWMNIGSVPVIMDNLVRDGLTEPAVVITTNANYLGDAQLGYPNLRDVIIPFVEDNYNVSTHPTERAFAGLSMGSFVTSNIVNHDPTMFGYYGPWSGGVSIDGATPNLAVPYILYGGGAWDFGLPNPDAVAALDEVGIVQNVVVSGAHDFNAWNQLFTVFAQDYLWKPGAFLSGELEQLADGVADSGLNKGQSNALTVKLNQVAKQVERGNTNAALGALGAFTNQVQAMAHSGKLSADEAAALTGTAEKVAFNLGYWN